MNLKLLKFSLTLLFSGFIALGCTEDNFSSTEDMELNISEMNFDGCKESLKSSDTERYIELKAEEGNKLRLKFINATLNCGGLDTTHAGFYNGILKVFFLEDPSANCICNFDLECVIDSLESRAYKLEVYVQGEEPQAKFTFTYSSRLNTKIYISGD